MDNREDGRYERLFPRRFCKDHAFKWRFGNTCSMSIYGVVENIEGCFELFLLGLEALV
jgi:hypothetical protein